MAEETDAMAARGVKNIFGQTVRVAEMESEGGRDRCCSRFAFRRRTYYYIYRITGPSFDDS